ncbi:MAG: hypothetical protein JOZ98_16060 [Solirubrobacterales bacterium]|nr:hypothetical protein [Solirubrobacterales bacterium]MBV9424426.1 hypothetical protein [Solirubrobacterales bacterium]MBV9797102.1 hypothetical protein [Solirubrobacterales bacterium]
MGKLLRRTVDGDELLVEWTPSDQASVEAAQAEYRHWRGQDYEAVQSDGVYYEPIVGDRLPLNAEEVILTTAMGGG